MLRTANNCLIPEDARDTDDIEHIVAGREWVVGIDVETYPDNPKRKTPDTMRDHLWGVGLSFYSGERKELTCYGVGDAWFRSCARLVAGRPWYAFNAIFDATVCQRHGITLDGEHLGDARIIAYLLGEPEADLKTLLSLRMGIQTVSYERLLWYFYADDIRGVPLIEQARYCGEQDAELCVRLERQMRKALQAENPRAYDVYEKVERHIVPILVKMSVKGIRYDRQEGQKRFDQAIKRRDALDALIAPIVAETGFKQYEMRGGEVWHPTCSKCHNGKLKKISCENCGGQGKMSPVLKTFNPGSSDQVRAFLYDHLGLEEKRFTGGIKNWMIERGHVNPEELSGSTDALALLQLKDAHPSIPLMLSRRKFKKDAEFLGKWQTLSGLDPLEMDFEAENSLPGSPTISTDLLTSERSDEGAPYPTVNDRTIAFGRLHTMFTNTTVASGRLSSRDPNLQQVTRRFRDLMVADPGTVLVAGDMGQLELVIAAYMSRDPVMIEILRNGWDMHRITAEAVYGIPWREIPKDSSMRSVSKVANYLSQYGGQKDKLQEGVEKLALSQPELGLAVPTITECAFILRQHRKKYTRYWEWTTWTIRKARECGYAETAFGRPWFCPDINSAHAEYRKEAERAVIAITIQGTAADLMKMAMVGIDRDEEMSRWGTPVLQVHDEIVSIVRSEYTSQYMIRLSEHMLLGQPFEPVINLTVDVLSGPSWGQTHK